MELELRKVNQATATALAECASVRNRLKVLLDDLYRLLQNSVLRWWDYIRSVRNQLQASS